MISSFDILRLLQDHERSAIARHREGVKDEQHLLRIFARKLRGDVRVSARGLLLGLFVHL
jgi:hypothetical protein